MLLGQVYYWIGYQMIGTINILKKLQNVANIESPQELSPDNRKLHLFLNGFINAHHDSASVDQELIFIMLYSFF